ncbi:hypothetical protein O1M63_18160 [Streptomyces mirabilis]|nr:hypothetical protein [Streptomyces mirabilis]
MRCSSSRWSASSQLTPTVVPEDIFRLRMSVFIRRIRSRASTVRSWICWASRVSRASSRMRCSDSDSSSAWSRRWEEIFWAKAATGSGPSSSATRTRMTPSEPSHSGR